MPLYLPQGMLKVHFSNSLFHSLGALFLSLALIVSLGLHDTCAYADSEHDIDKLESSPLYNDAKNNAWKEAIVAAKTASRKTNYQEAEKQALTGLKAAEKFGRNDNRVACSLYVLAEIYFSQKKYTQAEQHVQRAIGISDKLFGPEDEETQNLKLFLSMLQMEQGKVSNLAPMAKLMMTSVGFPMPFNDATMDLILEDIVLKAKLKGKVLGRESEALVEEQLSQMHASMDETTKILSSDWQKYAEAAGTYIKQNKYEDALASLGSSLKLLQKLPSDSAIQKVTKELAIAMNLYAIANVYLVQKQYQRAEPLLKESVRVNLKYLVPQHETTFESLRDLAYTYRKLGKAADAKRLYEQLVSIEDKGGFITLIREINQRRIDKGYMLLLQDKYTDAAQSFNEVLAAEARGSDLGSRIILQALDGLGDAYVALSKYQEAEPIVKRALEYHRKFAICDSDPDLRQCIKQYAIILRKLNRTADAKTFEKQTH